MLAEFARGIDERPVEAHQETKSLSTENTYPVDLRDRAEMEREVERMGEEVAATLAKARFAACTITLKVRYADFTTVTRSRTLSSPVTDAPSIAACAKDLLRRTEAAQRPVRLLGVGASTLVRDPMAQLPLFA